MKQLASSWTVKHTGSPHGEQTVLNHTFKILLYHYQCETCKSHQITGKKLAISFRHNAVSNKDNEVKIVDNVMVLLFQIQCLHFNYN